MSDIRGYSTISEHTDPSQLAQQLNRHRAEMNRPSSTAGGTVMQYVGDAVMAVFGAPEPSTDHADRALVAAAAMHAAQAAVNARVGRPRAWSRSRSASGCRRGDVAAALLGSDERLEYTVVGDAVNLCQRLQQFAADGEIVVSDATWEQLTRQARRPRTSASISSRAAPRRSGHARSHPSTNPQPVRSSPRRQRHDHQRTNARQPRRSRTTSSSTCSQVFRTFEQDTAPGAGAARRRPRHRPRRVRRGDGPVGLRQVDAAQHRRRPRRARRGRGRRSPASRWSARPRASWRSCAASTSASCSSSSTCSRA